MSMIPHSSSLLPLFFFFNDTATTEIYTLSLHDALPISRPARYCELVELTRAFPPADPRGDAIVCEHELRHRNDGEMRRAHPPLDLELDLQHETAGIDDRAEPARRLRIAAEDVTRLELYHPRLTLRNARDD